MEYCPYEIDADPGLFDLETTRLKTRYGQVVVRRSRERRSDVATIYIHGVGADWTTWTPVLQAEAALGLDVHDRILVNLPGFGDAENLIGTLEIADVGALFLSIAESLGYSRVRVVGHSMGGFLTLDMASRYPDNIESIHLVAGPYFSILTSIQHPIGSFRHSATVAFTFGIQYLLARTGQLEVWAFKVLYHLGLFRLLLFPFTQHPFRLRGSIVKALCEQVNPTGLLRTAANGDGYDADHQWAKIKCRIWAVFGEEDKMVPQIDMARLLRVQPASRCTTLADAAHMLHVEWPLQVVQALELWASAGELVSRDGKGNGDPTT